MSLFRHLVRAAAVILATVLCCGLVFAQVEESGNPQDYILSHYQLHIIKQNSDGVSGRLRLGALANPDQMDDYLWALASECKKYPDDFFSKAGVSEVVVCGDLHDGPAPIAGLFDARDKRLYLKYHWCELKARCRVTFHAFHHELGHALQSASWGDGHYDWADWDAVNPPDFHYGGGGDQELRADPEKDWGTWTTDQPGFLNAYSTTAPWEDRSEIMAALMNNADRWRLKPVCARDPIIEKKVELMAGLLSKLCGPSESAYFWDKALSSLKAPTAVARQTSPTPSSSGNYVWAPTVTPYFWQQSTAAAPRPQPHVSERANPAGPSAPVDLAASIGGDLIDASGNSVSFDTLKDKKYFLLYFSSTWCPHCRAFMPQFVDFYQNSKYRDQFEVIFVSWDKSESEMSSYLKEMPWMAVRFGSAGETFLKSNYSHGGAIPGLALIDSNGKLLSMRKGFAKNYDNGVDKELEDFSQVLAGDELVER